jgi:hypothetical protein
VRPSWVSAVVLPVPEAPEMIAPRRAETWCRLSWMSSREVVMTFWMTGVFTIGRPAWYSLRASS